MTQGKKNTIEQIVRTFAFAICELFCLITMLVFAIKGQSSRALACILSVACLCLPDLLSRLLKFTIGLPMYLLSLVYAVCPMLGHSYNLYYLLGWWDNLLHAFGGVAFAFFGAYLPKAITKKDDCSLLLCALTGLCFSVTVSVAWEIVEFACDTWFGMDMQKDTLVHVINSYMLGDEMGVVGSIQNIQTITINGVKIEGYVDIGLIDTMLDVILETLGAIFYATVYLLDKGTHFAIKRKPIEKNDLEQTVLS